MESPHDYRRLREALEVSQPGDLLALPDVAQAVADDPQLRLAFDRIQAWDANIRVALDRVAVPAALEERILARLSAASGTLADSVSAALEAAAMAPSESSASDSSIAEGTLPQPASRTARSLAYWSGVGAAAVTAAAVVIAAGYWLQLGSEVPIDQLAQQWDGELSDEWQPLDSAPQGFPFPEAMRVAATGWQWIGKRTAAPVVAYRLSNGKASARLYAARISREGLAGSPPLEPQQDTGGKAIGYWSPRKSNLVYVLVVDDSKLYPAFVRSASTPLAILLPLPFNTRPDPGALLVAPARKIA